MTGTPIRELTPGWWVVAILVVEGIESSAEFIQVVRRLPASRSLARLLHPGNEQRDQDSDDGYHYEELDEREAGTFAQGVA